MASGRAIACSDIRGYRDLIGVEGAVLVPPSDPAALGRAIAALARSPERRREMGRRNRAAAGELRLDARGVGGPGSLPRGAGHARGRSRDAGPRRAVMIHEEDG